MINSSNVVKILGGLLIAVIIIKAITPIFSFVGNSQNNQVIDYNSILSHEWSYYKQHYIQGDGRVIDYNTSAMQSTSEGQSYAMLQAVVQNDRKEFEIIRNWTFNNLGGRQDGLLSWQWGRRYNNTWGIIYENGGNNSATDGDEQTAYALLLAAKEWNYKPYQDQAVALIKNIYLYDTTSANNTRYIIGGNWANDTQAISQNTIYANPSYLQPKAYRMFAKADPQDDWNGVINSSIDLLNRCTFDPSNAAKIPSNWCIVDKGNMRITLSNQNFPPIYGYDAFRTYFNISLDCKGGCSANETSYLKQASNFLLYEYQQKKIGDTYNVVTKQHFNDASLPITSGMASAFYFTDKTKASDVYNNYMLKRYNSSSGQFGNNYYDSNWAWFATYLFSDKTIL